MVSQWQTCRFYICSVGEISMICWCLLLIRTPHVHWTHPSGTGTSSRFWTLHSPLFSSPSFSSNSSKTGSTTAIFRGVAQVRCGKWMLLSEAASAPLHNVYIEQFFFLQTERAQAYFQISRLSYHSTYIRPNSLGLEENRENSIFASLKL